MSSDASLSGKPGAVAAPMSLDGLKAFQPYVDAVAKHDNTGHNQNKSPDLHQTHVDLATVKPPTVLKSVINRSLEDEAMERQTAKLQAKKKVLSTETSNPEIIPAKEAINYESFATMDIRVGTILTAEKVAKTKKLMKLTIDTGIDQRTVVSGIAEHFEPEGIISQQVCILVNLEPREIKGILSQGMILMAENAEGKLTFVSPGAGMPNGAVIR